jgi:uncharacterized protein (TIRG00374 family)
VSGPLPAEPLDGTLATVDLEPGGVMNIQSTATAVTRPSRWRILGRIVALAITAVALYGVLPSLLSVFSEAPRLVDLNPLWFIGMLLCELGSFGCVWWLTRIAIPSVTWFVAGTSQLVANAVSRVVPGGAAVGTAVGWRMLAVSGINRATAGTAIAATSFISNGVLFAIPLVAVAGSIFGAPIPRDLTAIAWGGALVFLMLFALAFTIVRFDRPLRAFGRALERVMAPLYRRLNKDNPPTVEGVVRQRDQIISALGARWQQALAAAVGKWLLDYLALVCALYAVGARPRLSLVLLAYGVGAVAGMIPITPGGLGFVEAGLVGTLALAGIGGDQALLATLAYRIASYWLPILAGLVGWIAFRRRYGRPPDEADAEPASLPNAAYRG